MGVSLVAMLPFGDLFSVIVGANCSFGGLLVVGHFVLFLVFEFVTFSFSSFGGSTLWFFFGIGIWCMHGQDRT